MTVYTSTDSAFESDPFRNPSFLDSPGGGWRGLSLEINSSVPSSSHKTSPLSTADKSNVDAKGEDSSIRTRASSAEKSDPPSPPTLEKPRSARSLGSCMTTETTRSGGKDLVSRNRSSDLSPMGSYALEPIDQASCSSSPSKKLRKHSLRGRTSSKVIPLPGNLFTSKDEDGNRDRSNSPGRFLGRFFTKTEHSRRDSIKSTKKEEQDTAEIIRTLQDENEKLLKESKRLKKQLAKKSAAAKELEETQHFAAALQPSRSLALEQAELQLDCYEKMIEAKDKALANFRKKSLSQDKRIAYLEVLCLQNGIEIEDGIVEKLQRAVSIVSNSSNATGYITAEGSCSTYASFFGESCAGADDDDIWEEDLKDAHHDNLSGGNKDNKNDLGSALRCLPGPPRPNEQDGINKGHQSGISEAVVSLALEDLVLASASSSPMVTKKKDSNSWLSLEVDPFKASRHSKNSSAHSSSNSHASFRIPEDASITEETPVVVEDRNKRDADDANKSTGSRDVLGGSRRDRKEKPLSPKNVPSSRKTFEEYGSERSRSSKTKTSSAHHRPDGKGLRISPTRRTRSPLRTASQKRRAGTRPSNQQGAILVSPKGRTRRNSKDTNVVLNALEKSLGASMEFEAADLPLPSPRPTRGISA